MVGDWEGAGVNYERSLQLARELQDEMGLLATTGNLANAKWGAGDLDAATDSMRELVAMIRSSSVGTRRLLGFGLMNLAGLILEKKDIQASIEVAREGLPLVKREGSAWIFSDYGPERAVLEGKYAKAALLMGYADHAHTENGGMRAGIHSRTRQRVLAELRKALPAEEIECLRAEGAKLSEDEAWRLALED